MNKIKLISIYFIILLKLICSINNINTNKNLNIIFYIALKQNNLDQLKSYVIDVSDPYSINYGKYLNNEQINEIISPNKEDVDNLIEWLEEEKIIILKKYNDSLKCLGKIKDVERIFIIRINMIYNLKDEKKYSTTYRFTIPEKYKKIIDFIQSEYIPLKINNKNYKNNNKDISIVDSGYVGREVIQRLYNINNELLNNVSIGSIEFLGLNGFDEKDLIYNEMMNNLPINKIKNNNIIGHNVYPNMESQLDIQMMGIIAGNAEIWYENYIGWIYDWVVDFYNREKKPQVISISWGWSEIDQCNIAPGICINGSSKEYIERTNIEFLKIAANGISVIVSSGDAGSPGRTNENCIGYINERYMNPIYPGSSEWVTSVGATFLLNKKYEKNEKYNTKICNILECARGNIEFSANYYFVGWTSGAGFDRWIKRPIWQENMVINYFKKNLDLPKNKYWNKNGRAYPDVSAIGHNCMIYNKIYGWIKVDGTSCSSPIFASIITILNNYQQKKGKSQLGYLNPLLYKMYENDKLTFNDITYGNSSCTELKCCGKNYGFLASEGWDPVSGLGTPNVKRIMDWLDKNIK
jgi:tripeptidyl-peptidase-1